MNFTVFSCDCNAVHFFAMKRQIFHCSLCFGMFPAIVRRQQVRTSCSPTHKWFHEGSYARTWLATIFSIFSIGQWYWLISIVTLLPMLRRPNSSWANEMVSFGNYYHASELSVISQASSIVLRTWSRAEPGRYRKLFSFVSIWIHPLKSAKQRKTCNIEQFRPNTTEVGTLI